jgi:hypothetical protein
MLGILFIYFIGKAFYDLAATHGKSMWGFAILGVVSYYAGTFLFGVVVAVIGEFEIVPKIEEINGYLLNFMAIPFGALACWILYRLLENSWNRKKVPDTSTDVLDSDLINKL